MTELIIFYAVAAVIVVSAILMVTAKNIFHSALYLACAFFGVAGIFVLLDAFFLAGIQVLIYIGAVVVLAAFVINLTRQITGEGIPQLNKKIIPAAITSALTAVLIILAALKTDWATRIAQNTVEDKTALIGELLLTDFVLPFEIVSVLLLAALVGAVIIVSTDGEDEK